MPKIYDDQQQDTESLGRITGINPAEEAEMERAAQTGALDDIAEREGLYNPDRDNSDNDGRQGTAGLSSGQLRNAEAGDNNESQRSRKQKAANVLMNGWQPNLGKLAKNKFFIGGAAFGGISLVGVAMFIIFVLGAFKIPHFVENLTAYQFARVTRDAAQTSDSIMAQKMALDSADDSVYKTNKARYSDNAVGKAKDAWSKMDKLRPNKMIANMQRDNTLKFNYTDPSILRPHGVLQGVTIGDRTIRVNKPTIAARFIPGVQFAQDVRFVRDFAPALERSLASNDVGPIIRGSIGNNLRKQLGISLVAWNVGKYQGKSDADAKLQMERDAREKIKAGSNIQNPKVSDATNQAAEDANNAEEKALADDKSGKAIADSPNEVPTEVVKSLETSFSSTTLSGITKQIISFVNPVYAVATPVCMVYEGSLQNSGPTINEQSARDQRAFYLVASASSQVKDGYQANGTAMGAMSWKLGDIVNSNSELRAAGHTVDTHNSFSSQASPTGSFSIYDAIFPAPLDTIMNKASELCPAFTNVWAGAGLGIANLALVIGSGGAVGAGEGSAEVVANVTIKQIVTKIVTKFVSGGTYMKTIAKDTLKQGALIAGATLVANQIVLSQMGSAQSPLATGVSFDNQVDSGANQHAQEIERQGFYGRPLTQDEVAVNNTLDAQYLAGLTSQQSATERYLSPSNPNSLVSRVATLAGHHFGSENMTNLFNLGSSVLNPLNAFATSVGSMSTARVGAASTDTFNYGNIQWGWSAAEQQKLTLGEHTNLPVDPTYTYLENRRILDQSGKEDEIAATYGPCFDSSKGPGDLTTADTGSSGDNSHFVIRDTAGNVSGTQGLCSATNLSFNNQKYGDLVFRWRVDHRYEAQMETNNEIQNPTAVDPSSQASTPTAPTGSSVGWVWPVHKEDLKNPSVALTQCWLGSSVKPYHAAVDIGVTNKNVYAAHSGTIVAGTGPGFDGYNTFIIDTGPDAKTGKAHLYAVYEHMQSFAVTSGSVTAGQLIGKSGEVGAPGAPHLHFGISDSAGSFGIYANPWHTANPLDFLPADDPVFETRGNQSCKTADIKDDPSYGFSQYRSQGAFSEYK